VENLLHASPPNGARPGDTRRRVLALLDRLALDPADTYRPVESLSRGVQQLVAIARACVGQHRLLLLDEPTAGLDPRSRRAVHALLHYLRDADGVTILLATHDLAEAEALCDRVAVLDRGRLVAVDTPAGLRQRAGLGASLEEAFLLLTDLPVAA
jgi:ABC-2 type transport system ATP-binding protein